ncbi:hypothetical protein [Sphingomonas sp. Leaf22]|nr:hypothetical protein [Sphingomonas sp. Leaf22]
MPIFRAMVRIAPAARSTAMPLASPTTPRSCSTIDTMAKPSLS